MEIPATKIETRSVMITNHSPTAKQHPTATTTAQTLSPSSASSSPSHEFSFTISFNNYSCPAAADLHGDKKNAPRHLPAAQPRAIDLTPADDIFFRGHLVPFHLLTKLPKQYSSPPRSSTDSLDSFTLPVTKLLAEDGRPKIFDESTHQSQSNSFNVSKDNEHNIIVNETNNVNATSNKGKSGKIKSFSLLVLKRWRSTKGQDDQAKKPKRKLIRISHFLLRFFKPLMFFKGTRPKMNRDLGRHDDRLDTHPSGRRVLYSQSLSGNLLCSSRDRSMDLRGRRGEFSAPTSMRTSPTNSGRMLGKAGVPPRPSDSTMEELQAAIQAAIAHCKNSNIASDRDQQSR